MVPEPGCAVVIVVLTVGGARAGCSVQLADALDYAHARGGVHRDVKPANVLVDRDGRVKLADFDIAKLLGETVKHTQTGTVIGTAAYLSPEQVQGQPVDGAADIYSLGLVRLEALTAVRAFPGSPTEAALARLHRAPDIPAQLSPGWRDLLMDMLPLDPAARPSAGAIAQRLSGVVEPVWWWHHPGVLAGILRTGRARTNTAADLITVLA